MWGGNPTVSLINKDTIKLTMLQRNQSITKVSKQCKPSSCGANFGF